MTQMEKGGALRNARGLLHIVCHDYNAVDYGLGHGGGDDDGDRDGDADDDDDDERR